MADGPPVPTRIRLAEAALGGRARRQRVLSVEYDRMNLSPGGIRRWGPSTSPAGVLLLCAIRALRRRRHYCNAPKA